MKDNSKNALLEFLSKINTITSDTENSVYFYRGEDCADYPSSIPNLIREKKFNNYEAEMFYKIMSSKPDEFNRNDSTFNHLVKMQHYYLPTRLLDVTTNPLVALFFACAKCGDKDSYKDGRIKIYKVDKKDIKHFESPTVCLLSNLAKVSGSNGKFDFFKDFDNNIYDDNHHSIHNNKNISKLLDCIWDEKPQFELRIRKKDLMKTFFVLPKLDNPRIKAQSGAFVLFGIGKSEPEYDADIHVSHEDKDSILYDLEKLNIKKEILFPELSGIAEAIKEFYQTPEPAVSDTKSDINNIIKEDAKETEEGISVSSGEGYIPWWECATPIEHGKDFSSETDMTEKKISKFYLMLSNSLSLNAHEKNRVLTEIPNLSKFQIEALMDVWEEENLKFIEHEKENPSDIAKLKHKALHEWAELSGDKALYWEYIKTLIEKNNDCFPMDNIHMLLMALIAIKSEYNTAVSNNIDTEVLKILVNHIIKEDEYIDFVLGILIDIKQYELIMELVNENILDLAKEKYNKLLGLVYIKLKQYDNAYEKFVNALNLDECFLDYAESALLVDKISEAKEYLQNLNIEKCEHAADYIIIKKFLVILIRLIEKEKESEIEQDLENLYKDLENRKKLQINWDMTEVDDIFKKYDIANNYQLNRVKDKILELMNEKIE